MSGGAYDYGFYKLEEYCGNMKDADLNEMLRDLQTLLHDLEWCDSGDTNEFDYAKSANMFKEKWMPGRAKVLAERNRNWELGDLYDDILYYRSHKPCFYVLHYDYKTGDYLNEIVFKTWREASEEFLSSKTLNDNDRIELMFAPDKDDELFSDNVVLRYKVEREEGQL